MPHRVSAILDGKSRAMVQTAQTQCALRLDPHRLAVAHLYRRRRASVGTKSATGTTVCHQMEMPRLPLAPVGGMINTSNHMRYSHSLCVSAPAGHNSAYRCVYLLSADASRRRHFPLSVRLNKGVHVSTIRTDRPASTATPLSSNVLRAIQPVCPVDVP